MLQLGTDNLFHKRKAKAASDLARKQAARQAFEKILIVCEGEKTEPHYFKEVVDHYELHTANVSISGKGGSAPRSVVEHGMALFFAEKQAYPKNPFDRVYFVFDRDQHETYDEALAKIVAAPQKNTFFAINSVPSFEFWLLIHFTYTTQPFKAIGKTSSGKAVLDKLKNYLRAYEKGSKNTFSTLLPLLPTAKINANMANANAQAKKTDNPTTQVHVLLDFMQNMKK
jgi:hypothetical protein